MKISVVIPTYNREKQILRAIGSVLQQTVQVHEIVVVDDGSTDDTCNTVKSCTSKVRYLYQDNAGVAAARNAGVYAASGDWIAFLDSDDEWHPKKNEMQIACLRQTGADICCSAHEDDLGYSSVTLFPEMKIGEMCFFSDPVALMLKNNTHPLIQTVLVKRSLLLRIGLFDQSLLVAEDTKLMYQLALTVGIAYVNQSLFILNRKRSQAGLSDDTELNVALERYECYCRVQSEMYWRLLLHKPLLAKKVKQNLSYFLSRRAELFVALKEYRNARILALEAFHFSCRLKTLFRSLVIVVCPRILFYVVSKKRSVNRIGRMRS